MSDAPEKRCTGSCGKTLPATPEYFHRDLSKGKDGLRSRCKTCININSAEIGKKGRKNLVIESSVDEAQRKDVEPCKDFDAILQELAQKQCTGPCGNILPATDVFFHKNTYYKDGLHYKCKNCQNEYYRGLRAKQKKATCEACKQHCDNLYRDTDNTNETSPITYGHLCPKCYWLVDSFRGDCTRMGQVLRYLQRTRQQSTQQK